MTSKNKRPIFTIITAAYNVADYIEETIKSVLRQSIGKQNIQYILVDDGSTDDTGKICDKYAQKYPEIITVIHQKNAGVASARNAGLELIKGKYVNFLDGDDKLSPNTLKKVKKFFDKYGKQVDVVSIPLMFFDGESGSHILNHKFDKGTRVIDLEEEYDKIQLSMASTFVKASSLKNRQFDTKLKYAEDAKLLQPILMKKSKLGVVADATYWYRKRQDWSSAVQSSTQNPQWYFPYNKYFIEDILNNCKDKSGKLPKFIQYILAYDLVSRVSQPSFPLNVMNKTDLKKFHKQIFDTYKQIDDDIILGLENMLIEPRFVILTKKHGHLPKMTQREDGSVAYSYDGKLLYFDLAYVMINLDFVKIYPDHITIEGWLPHNTNMEKDLPDLYIEVSGKTYQPKLVPRQTIWTDKTMGIPLYKRIGFEFKIPLDKNAKLNELNFYRSSPFGPVQCKNILFRQFCPINEQISGSYCFKHGWTIRYKSGTIIAKYDGHKKLKYELNLLIELLKRNRRTFLSRLLYHMVKPFHRKPIWLVSDRILKADDCGEAFFQYLRQHQKQSIRTYFVIDKNSTDYSRIKKIGPTLKAFSVRHKLKHLLADCIITSSGDDKIMFPFTGGHYGYSDILCDIKHIFLQHGVIKDDLSRWLNRYNMNLYGFITSARPEYNSILNTKDYAYTKKQVWLTGLSRFDYLYNSPQKLITIAPTWRKWLVESGSYATTGVYAKSASFKSSQFFTFYNALINDPRLIKAAKKYGYKLALFLHPNFRIYTEDFEQNEITTFHDFNTTYRDIYATSSLLLTDYSSAIFDFVYLKKPVVYSQPDKDEFFSGNHSYDQGYYNYEKDGFGEVLYNLDDTVNTLIEYMRNDCKMKPKYEKRVDKFFAFHDKKNCERIYDKIIEMEKKEQ